MSNPIALSMTPSQRRQSIINPRENSATDWRYSIERSIGLAETRLPADRQSDNYRSLNEPARQFPTAHMRQPTGEEPVYGNLNFFLNPLEEFGPLPKVEMDLRQSRINGPNRAQEKFMRAPHYQYPYNAGIPINRNFIGSSAYMVR